MGLFDNIGVGLTEYKMIQNWLTDKELEYVLEWLDKNNRFNYKDFMYITQFYSIDTIPEYIQFNNTSYNFDKLCGFYLKMQQIILDPNTTDIIGELNKHILFHFPLLTEFTITLHDNYKYKFFKKYDKWDCKKFKTYEKDYGRYDVIDEQQIKLYTGNKISQKRWKNERNYI